MPRNIIALSIVVIAMFIIGLVLVAMDLGQTAVANFGKIAESIDSQAVVSEGSAIEISTSDVVGGGTDYQVSVRESALDRTEIVQDPQGTLARISVQVVSTPVPGTPDTGARTYAISNPKIALFNNADVTEAQDKLQPGLNMKSTDNSIVISYSPESGYGEYDLTGAGVTFGDDDGGTVTEFTGKKVHVRAQDPVDVSISSSTSTIVYDISLDQTQIERSTVAAGTGIAVATSTPTANGAVEYAVSTTAATSSVTLSAADIAALDTTRQVLIPAAPAGHYTLVHYVMVIKSGGTAPSSGDDNTSMSIGFTESSTGLEVSSQWAQPYDVFSRHLYGPTPTVSTSPRGWLHAGNYAFVVPMPGESNTSGLLSTSTPYGQDNLVSGSPLVIYGRADADYNNPQDPSDPLNEGTDTAAQNWYAATTSLGSISIQFIAQYEYINPGAF